MFCIGFDANNSEPNKSLMGGIDNLKGDGICQNLLSCRSSLKGVAQKCGLGVNLQNS